MDVSGTLDVDGVHAVYTREGLEDRFADPLSLIIPHEAIEGGRTQNALARDEVRYGLALIGLLCGLVAGRRADLVLVATTGARKPVRVGTYEL